MLNKQKINNPEITMSGKIENNDILTTIKTSLGKGIRIINIRSKEVYGVIKIKNKIQQNRRKIKKYTSELGEAVYKMYKLKDSFDVESLKAKCTEIIKTEQEIHDFEEELKVLHINAQTELGKLKAISKPEDS